MLQNVLFVHVCIWLHGWANSYRLVHYSYTWLSLTGSSSILASYFLLWCLIPLSDTIFILLVSLCTLWIISRVHNISREGEFLTAYTCFKCTLSSTESTPPSVNKISAHIRTVCLYFIKHNSVFDIIDINVLAYWHWTIKMWTSSAFGVLASHITWNSLYRRWL